MTDTDNQTHGNASNEGQVVAHCGHECRSRRNDDTPVICVALYRFLVAGHSKLIYIVALRLGHKLTVSGLNIAPLLCARPCTRLRAVPRGYHVACAVPRSHTRTGRGECSALQFKPRRSEILLADSALMKLASVCLVFTERGSPYVKDSRRRKAESLISVVSGTSIAAGTMCMMRTGRCYWITAGVVVHISRATSSSWVPSHLQQPS